MGYETAFRLLEMDRYYQGTPILIYRVSTVIDSGQIEDR